VPCDLEHFYGGESNRWTKTQAFSYSQLHIVTSIFPTNKLGCVALWNEFKVNSNLDIEESDEHFL
jgi:hypothetical protein